MNYATTPYGKEKAMRITIPPESVHDAYGFASANLAP
jgi:hypothetical protein